MRNFINEANIIKILEDSVCQTKSEVKDIVAKARSLRGLALREAAILLQCEEMELIDEIFAAAKKVKEAIYGDRIVLFAPLYLSNICSNNCLYCGFRKDNLNLKRRCLTMEEIEEEVKALELQGHKRLLLVAGEDLQSSGIEYIEKAIHAVYRTKNNRGAIRRVNVNIAPLTTDDFRRLKQTGIGTYQLFQETYHRKTYERMHPSGPKKDYEWRLFAMDRAQEACIDDVGIGALFGLYDYKFEVLALLSHSIYLEAKFGAGPHTISVPRVKDALNAPLAHNVPYPISDYEFKKIVAVIRLSVPYTGMILSTREPSRLRDELLSLGISQISAGSRTNPGAYTENIEHAPDSEQFHLEDTRTQLEVIKDIIKEGYFPSFCTACYRVGRTGRDFMKLAKPGDIKKFCVPNCILTFQEYVLDYGDAELRRIAGDLIEKEMKKIEEDGTKMVTISSLERLEAGERDLYI